MEIKCSLTESEISKMLLKTRNFACKRDWMASYIWIIHMLTILSSSDTANVDYGDFCVCTFSQNQDNDVHIERIVKDQEFLG